MTTCNWVLLSSKLLELQTSADTEGVRRQRRQLTGRTNESSDDQVCSQRARTDAAKCLIIDHINNNIREHMAKNLRMI